jgi:hypothetical protein
MVASAVDDPNTSEECENLGSLITHQKDGSEKIWGGIGGIASFAVGHLGLFLRAVCE